MQFSRLSRENAMRMDILWRSGPVGGEVTNLRSAQNRSRLSRLFLSAIYL